MEAKPKLKYKKPCLHDLRKGRAVWGGDCNGSGSSADAQCNSNGVTATLGCHTDGPNAGAGCDANGPTGPVGACCLPNGT